MNNHRILIAKLRDIKQLYFILSTSILYSRFEQREKVGELRKAQVIFREINIQEYKMHSEKMLLLLYFSRERGSWLRDNTNISSARAPSPRFIQSLVNKHFR